MADTGYIPVSPGRPAGVPNKLTELTRVSLRTALEILRNGGGENPVEASQKIARFLEGMSQKRIEQLATETGRMEGGEFDRIVNALYKAANIQLRLADYVFPKPGRIDLPETNGPSRPPRTMEELSRQLEERGLPGWVFGDDAPILDLTPEEGVDNSRGVDNDGNGNGEIPE